MKKLFQVAILLILLLSSSIVFSSCTEEEVKVESSDNSGKGEKGERP